MSQYVFRGENLFQRLIINVASALVQQFRDGQDCNDKGQYVRHQAGSIVKFEGKNPVQAIEVKARNGTGCCFNIDQKSAVSQPSSSRHPAVIQPSSRRHPAVIPPSSRAMMTMIMPTKMEIFMNDTLCVKESRSASRAENIQVSPNRL